MTPGVHDLFYFFSAYIQADISNNYSLASALYRIITSYKVPLLTDSSSNHYTYIHDKYTIDLDLGVEATKGDFGHLYYCARNNRPCFLKRSKNPLISLKNEAFMQMSAYWILRHYSMEWAIPPVYDIIEHPIFGVCFTMDIITDALLFGEHLQKNIDWTRQCEKNDILILEIIVQLAIYFVILERDIGLNHRDLKINNVLMVKSEPIKNSILDIGLGKRIILNSQVRAVLIDFGFACIGDIERPKYMLSATDYLPVLDSCPKVGRDMFIIFAHLWNVRAIRCRVTPKLSLLFKKWLIDGKKKDWALWISADLDPKLKTISTMVNSQGFAAPNTSSLEVLKDIAGAYSEVISFIN